MRNFNVLPQRVHLQKGFTFIELMLSIVLISLISTYGITSFTSYNKSQTLIETTKGIGSVLQVVKSRAATQVKPATCGTRPLEGYRVVLCGITGASCFSSGNYELQVVCGGSNFLVPMQDASTQRFPGDIRYNTTSTTASNIYYKVLTGGVERNGTIVLTNGSRTSQIQVDTFGNVRVIAP